ncbi:MAG: patatin-like phospholipase family protein [Betaproteobacteria bacterium]|nr:patatin-like phospholipase family protein [Betaproteobacteria bacterium]
MSATPPNRLRFLRVQAGPRALAHLRAHGLRAQDIDAVPGAAGGPKGLGLARLDEYLFTQWLPSGAGARGAKARIDLIGASIGAWRFAAVCKGQDEKTARLSLRAFATAYSEQKYPKRVDADFVSAYARDLIDSLFRGHEAALLANPLYRLHVLAVRGKGLLMREARGRTHGGFALAALANAAGRPQLARFMDRVWFHAAGEGDSSSSGIGFPGDWDRFHTHHVPLTPENFGDALIASGSIPLVLKGVPNIAGAPPGTYWDGGIIDYHLHLPYPRASGLVLYPHFTHRIVPGWLDKALPWRKARGAWLDNVVLISPSREYLARLPLKKLPDRGDFKRFVDDYEGRLDNWRFAMNESERLAAEFIALTESEALQACIEPLT